MVVSVLRIDSLPEPENCKDTPRRGRPCFLCPSTPPFPAPIPVLFFGTFPPETHRTAPEGNRKSPRNTARKIPPKPWKSYRRKNLHPAIPVYPSKVCAESNPFRNTPPTSSSSSRPRPHESSPPPTPPPVVPIFAPRSPAAKTVTCPQKSTTWNLKSTTCISYTGKCFCERGVPVWKRRAVFSLLCCMTATNGRMKENKRESFSPIWRPGEMEKVNP